MEVSAAEVRAPTVTTGRLLGLDDGDLEDTKEQAAVASVLQQGRAAKKKKLTHGLFFDDERGLKKVLDSFPKTRFHGKDEFQDLKVLLQSYQRWFKELAPWEANFEDAVWKTRELFQTKDRGDDGVLSDARERLHLLRFEYKTSGGGGTKAAAAAATAAVTPSRPVVSKQLSEEARRRIEENKKRALELRRAREAAAGGAAAAVSSAAAAPASASASSAAAAAATGVAAPPTAAAAPTPAVASQAAAAPPATAPAVAAAPFYPMEEQMWEEDDDVFGFGGGLDDP